MLEDNNYREMRFPTLLRRPSAFLPMTMSLAALGVVLFHILLFGTAREADEGTAAHIWQILMAAQVPIVIYFAFKWLPRSPAHAAIIVTLQVAAILAALAPVYFLGL